MSEAQFCTTEHPQLFEFEVASSHYGITVRKPSSELRKFLAPKCFRTCVDFRAFTRGGRRQKVYRSIALSTELSRICNKLEVYLPVSSKRKYVHMNVLTYV